MSETLSYDPEAEKKYLASPAASVHVASLLTALGTLETFDDASIEAAIRQTAADRGVKAGELIHIARVAMTGRTTSPGIFEVLTLLGRDRVLGRLRQLATYLTAKG